MADDTLISWADDTLNIWAGCTRISNGPLGACISCYAANLMDDRMHRVEFGGPGAGVGTRDEMKDWRSNLRRIERRAHREYQETGRQRFVFVNSLADFFDNHPDCAPWRQAFFDEVRDLPKRGHERPHLVLLLLTKRPQNIIRMAKEAGGLPSICALGTTTENRQTLTLNGAALMAALGVLRDLDDTPALFGFLSCEPLMEPLDLDEIGFEWAQWIRWIIAGGETDQGKHRARPTHPDWIRDLRDQSASAGAVFHFKQWGEWAPGECAASTIGRTVETADWYGGKWTFGRLTPKQSEGMHIDDEPTLYRVGRRTSGRLLDGVLYDGRPVA